MIATDARQAATGADRGPLELELVCLWVLEMLLKRWWCRDRGENACGSDVVDINVWSMGEFVTGDREDESCGFEVRNCALQGRYSEDRTYKRIVSK